MIQATSSSDNILYTYCTILKLGNWLKLGYWHGYNSQNVFRFHHFPSIHLCDYIILNNSIKCRAPCNHKHNQDTALLHKYKTLATYLYVSVSIYLSIIFVSIATYSFYGCFVLESTAYILMVQGEGWGGAVLSKIVENKFKQKKVVLQTSIVCSQLSFLFIHIWNTRIKWSHSKQCD